MLGQCSGALVCLPSSGAAVRAAAEPRGGCGVPNANRGVRRYLIILPCQDQPQASGTSGSAKASFDFTNHDETVNALQLTVYKLQQRTCVLENVGTGYVPTRHYASAGGGRVGVWACAAGGRWHMRGATARTPERTRPRTPPQTHTNPCTVCITHTTAIVLGSRTGTGVHRVSPLVAGVAGAGCTTTHSRRSNMLAASVGNTVLTVC